MQASAENEGGKRDPRDFALWKAAKPGEPTWATPWGPGRPGWHLECSSMAAKYLGAQFDIHGGGLDLVFPHHENERAQSDCGLDFERDAEMARFWMHHGLLNVGGGEKMSKSLGNTFLVDDVLPRHASPALRYYLLAAHYRSAILYGPDQLAEASAAYEGIEGFVLRNQRRCRPTGRSTTTIRCGRRSPTRWTTIWPRRARLRSSTRPSRPAIRADDPTREYQLVRRMLATLGLDPLSQWPSADGGNLQPVIDHLVAGALERRAQARREKDWAASDAIRDELAAAGIAVEDTPQGQRWELAR